MMKNPQRSLQRGDSIARAVLYLAFELSKEKWRLAFSDRKRIGFVTINSRDLVQLKAAIKKARLLFSLSNDVRIVSCCEAGPDGFWLHRYLGRCGVKNLVVDLSSIKINQRKQRATGQIDAAKLLKMLISYHGGEKKAMPVVRVPSSYNEDGRNLNQKLEALNKKHTRSRIAALNKVQTRPRAMALNKVQARPRVEALNKVQARPLAEALNKVQAKPRIEALKKEQVRPRAEALKKEQNRHRIEAIKKAQAAHRKRPGGFSLIQQGLRELSGDKRFGFLAVMVLLVIFTGYFLLNLKSQSSLRWGLEDIAPQEYESPILKAKESFELGLTDEKEVIEEVQVTESVDNREVANTDIQTTTQVEFGNQKDDYSEKQDIMLIPDQKLVVYFNHESNELPNHAFKTLDQIIKFSAHYPESEIVVEGYTDSFGRDFNNKELSKIRADAVKNYLVSHGIPATNIKTFGMGSENPIESKETVEGRNQNRRVEIKLNKK